MKLVEHLNIITPIRDVGGTVTYFMPCMLSHAVYSADFDHCYISPLLITFRCGQRCLSALTVNLISKRNNGETEMTWHIREDKVSRNRVTFELKQENHDVSITTHATHLEISVHATKHICFSPPLVRYVTHSDTVLNKPPGDS